MKRYQIAILFFALGIFSLAFIFGYLAKQQEKEDMINKPVDSTGQDSMATIKVFFSRESDMIDCTKVYAVDREVTLKNADQRAKLGELAYLALAELLKGPEGNEGITSINANVKIQSIAIAEGTAKVDFSEELNQGVAGSCRVQAIRAQIEQTLKQFPEIKEVVISVNGNTDEILQP